MKKHYVVHESAKELPIEWNPEGKSGPLCVGIDIVEKAQVPKIKNYYVLSYDNDELVYMSYFQLLSVTPAHFNIQHKPFQQMALSMALNLVRPTLLVVGNLFRHDVLFFRFVKEGLRDEQKAQYYQEATDYMIKYTNASGIFMKDVEKSIAPFIEKDTSYFSMNEDISMEIDIPDRWKVFADYEADLKHKYLQRCRKIRKAFDGIRVVEFSASQIETYSKEMELLYAQVSNKQLVSMGHINDRFFVELKNYLKDAYKVCGYFLDNKLIAFSSAIKHEHEYDMNYIGIDYAYNQSHQLYFNILFHCLESAMATHSRKLILGRTAPEAKAILGCVPDYRYSFYKLRNVIVNWFYKMVASYFQEQQGEKWKDRHPFKSGYYQKQ